MESMEMKEIESAIEGILFASGEPVQVDRICVALDMDRATVEQVLQKLSPLREFGRNIITRNPEPMERGKIYEYSQEPADLVLAMAEIQNRAERALPPPRTAFQDIVQHEPYPVENKAREIIRKLKEHGNTRFLLLFRGSRSRSEVVATFLAVLELCRAHVLHLAGSETDCTVRQEGELPENLML